MDDNSISSTQSIPEEELLGKTSSQDQDLINISEDISYRKIYPASEPQEPDILRQRQQISSNLQQFPTDLASHATEPRSTAGTISGSLDHDIPENNQPVISRHLMGTMMQGILDNTDPTDA